MAERDNPTVTKFEIDLAVTHNGIGVLQSDTGRLAEALASFEHARTICERLARENPTVTEFLRAEAASHRNIGSLQRAAGRTPEALASYEQARTQPTSDWRASIRRSPEFASDLGGTLGNLALIDLSQRQYDKAHAKLATAIEWQRKGPRGQSSSPDVPAVPRE